MVKQEMKKENVSMIFSETLKDENIWEHISHKHENTFVRLWECTNRNIKGYMDILFFPLSPDLD